MSILARAVPVRAIATQLYLSTIQRFGEVSRDVRPKEEVKSLRRRGVLHEWTGICGDKPLRLEQARASYGTIRSTRTSRSRV